jgi:hypothetical protein
MLDTIANQKHRFEPVPEITPCDNCKRAERCKAEGLACQAFVLFKRCSRSPQRWSCAPRLPSKDLYVRAMQPLVKKVAPPREAADYEMELDLESEFADREE